MREKPWAVIDLLDPDKEIKWYATSGEATIAHINDAVDIQYRPGRKGKAKK
jgi:hypothetical protein